MAKRSLTYLVFAEQAIAIANGEVPENFDLDAFIEKAEKLIERETKKADYSKANKKPSVSKVSQATIDNAELILGVLSTEPMTTSEINEALGVTFEPLTISNAIRYLERTMGIVRGKKVEQVTRIKDGISLTNDVPKTSYALAE